MAAGTGGLESIVLSARAMPQLSEAACFWDGVTFGGEACADGANRSVREGQSYFDLRDKTHPSACRVLQRPVGMVLLCRQEMDRAQKQATCSTHNDEAESPLGPKMDLAG